jgi:hypothetical protein
MLQTRIFPKFHKYHWQPDGGIGEGIYLHNQDLIARFRFFENGGAEAQGDAQSDLKAYLDKYTSGPPTKAEMLNRIAEGQPIEESGLLDRYKIKRLGKDKDDVYWQLGKIHGIEYISWCTEEELQQTGGDPIKLQRLINRVMDENRLEHVSTFDQGLEKMQAALEEYKATLDSIAGSRSFVESDRKKLLALPFYLSKRVELPEPKKGQKEYQLFKELYGVAFDQYDDFEFDPEEKITEYNYEKFIDPEYLKSMDTSSEEFKLLIKRLNFGMRTTLEQHRDNQDRFKQLMPVLRRLNEEEARIFLHMIKNKQRQSASEKTNRSVKILDQACSNQLKETLARISEDENWQLKNAYNHQTQTMHYARKDKMPIDVRQVKKALRNKHLYRAQITNDVVTYEQSMMDTHFEDGLLTFLTETAEGEMKDLLDDLGIKKETLIVSDLQEILDDENEFINSETDEALNIFINSRINSIDMTDYEGTFVGYGELGIDLPFMDNIKAAFLNSDVMPTGVPGYTFEMGDSIEWRFHDPILKETEAESIKVIMN